MLVSRKVDGVHEFVAIQRSGSCFFNDQYGLNTNAPTQDTGIWAMPGGMVDGLAETFCAAAVREFFEEVSQHHGLNPL